MAANPLDEPSADVIKANLLDVRRAMTTAYEHAEIRSSREPQLVAVTKTKSVEAISAAYSCGQRLFGENYVQEIEIKAPQLPQDIQWHFIGHLQSNKALSLLEAVPNLAVMQTLDSEKLAGRLNSAVEKVLESRGRRPLDVFIQVNTSGEESKSGVGPGSEAIALAKFVAGGSCPNLRLLGLMTIGLPDYTSRKEDFLCLARCRDEIARALSIEHPDSLELSMGMSGDFEAAIIMGSTVVRVGSKLFGPRATKQH